MWGRTDHEYDYVIKIVVIGDSYVGKSSILTRYCDSDFSPTFITTIGIDFKVRTVKINNKNVKLQIWDTAGQERFKSITTSYYRGAKAIMIVYDITSQDSFNHVREWMSNIDHHCDNDRNAPHKVLIGNKSDLEEKRVITEKDGLVLAQKNHFEFIEVSAKTGTNIEKVFHDLALEILKELDMKTTDLEKDVKHLPSSLSQLDVMNADVKKKCCVE